MSNEQYRAWMLDILRAANEAERQAAIERRLTKFDFDFTFWLEQQVEAVQQAAPQTAQKLRALLGEIYRLVSTGDYSKAEFDEAAPANPKEIVLALARRVRREELDLDAAAEQARQMLAGDQHAFDWQELGESILRAADEFRFVELAELLYRTSEGLPDFVADYTDQAVIKALDAEAMRKRDRHEFEAAIATYERAAAIAEATGRTQLQMLMTMSMGDVCRLQLPALNSPDRQTRAERHYRRALELCEQGQLDPEQRASVLLELGKTLVAQGRPREGIPHLAGCVAIRRAQEEIDPQDLMYGLLMLARAYGDIGEYRSASEHYREALAWAPDDESRVSLLGGLSFALSYLDDAGTDAVIAELVQLADRLDSQDLRSTAYSHLGYHRGRHGDLQGALDAYHVAREAARAAGDEGTEARTLISLGQVYAALGQQAEAADMFRQAERTHSRLEDRDASAHNANSRSQLRLKSGDLIGAALNAALAYQRYHQAQRRTDMSIPAYTLGYVYLRMGDLERAEKSLRYSLRKAESSATLSHQCMALGGLAAIQARRGEPAAAAETYAQAIALAETLGDISQEADLREARGRALERLPGTIEEAEREYRRAVGIVEAQRSGFRAAERRIQAQDEDPYIRLVSLLARQHGDSQKLGEALTFAERARSRTLAELLSRTQFLKPASLPPALAQRETELLAQLRRIEEIDESGLEAAQRHARLNGELEDVWRQMALIDDACQDYVDLRRTPMLSVADIRGLLVG